jgi:hypothetical protein
MNDSDCLKAWDEDELQRVALKSDLTGLARAWNLIAAAEMSP